MMNEGCKEMIFPDWREVTPEKITLRLEQALVEGEKAVAALEVKTATGFEDFVWPLTEATRAVTHTWGMVTHLLSVMNSSAWRQVEESFQSRLVAFSLRVSQSQALYETARRLCAQEKGVRQRILMRMVQVAELSGVGLTGAARERFNEIEVRLARLGVDFQNALLDATAAFSYEKDGVRYTIDDAAYPETMRTCADREVRETLCRARAMRAPENAARVEEMLALRAESAALLGFQNYAELSFADKCAPSVSAALAMLDALDVATREPALREAAELEKASGLSALKPWDLAYCAERLRERRYAYSEDELKRYFAFEEVLAGLFGLVKSLFGVTVIEKTGAAKPSVWHPDVRFFEVREQDQLVAHFYLDAFVRNGLKQGGAWMNEFRNRSERRAEKPLAVVVLNLKQPDATGLTQLTLREVETLFHEFGHALQCMLTRVTEEEAAGISLVEWDAVEVASQFMENWCLDEQTHFAVPEELKARVRAARNFRAASACRRQLAFARLDLKLHGAAEGLAGRTPEEVKTAEFAHFGLPVVEEDRFLCGFGHIFGGGYAAGYYSYKWSEVMSADCYGAFEAASDSAARAIVGRRYRETILALGGSLNALEVFRLFRGRDPEIAALLRQQGLLSDNVG